MNYILKAYTLQDIGLCANQEDCFFPPFIDPCHFDETKRDWTFFDGTPHTDERLFIVSDGNGGQDRGEVASRIVTKAMSDNILSAAPIEGLFCDEMMQAAVDEAVAGLHTEGDTDIATLSVAMAALKFHADGATITHAGNCRVYQFRPAHTEKGSGKVSKPATILFRTEDNDMRLSTQATQPMVFDHLEDIREDDTFLLCTDGLNSCMSDEDLCSIVCDHGFVGAETVQQLLHRCDNATDNMTAIVVKVHKVMNAAKAKNQEETVALPVGTVLRSQYLESTNSTALVYHVEKVLGQGAFGISYLVNASVVLKGQLGAVHTGVHVAMKEFFIHNAMTRHGNEVVITEAEDKVKLFREKFREEAMQLSMLSHPNVVKVLDVFEANNTIYYIMEYLPDGNLLNYINELNGVPEQEAICIIRQIGSALNYIHLNKMLHLDVKPANVMRDLANDAVKLIDFGLARRYTDEGELMGREAVGAGTSGYAPLEQGADTVTLPFSPQMDVYALGATYYKILTGITPDNAIVIQGSGLNTIPLIKKNVSQQSIAAIKAAMQPLQENRLKSVVDFLQMLPDVDDAAIFRPKKNRNWLKWLLIAIAIITVLIGYVTTASV